MKILAVLGYIRGPLFENDGRLPLWRLDMPLMFQILEIASLIGGY